MHLFFRKKSENKSTIQEKDIIQNDIQPSSVEVPNTEDLETSNPSYDPNNIFIIATSDDGTLQLFRELFPSKNLFKLFLKNSQNNRIIKQEYPFENGRVKNVFSCTLNRSGYAVVIDTYFSDNPHAVLDLYLYDNFGKELFHVYYTKNGPRCYKFSDSGKYFVLMDHNSFYIYDMENQQIKVFSPEDLCSSNSTDFIILENQHCIAYCYTQHPDTPYYHFTFLGHLIEENAFRDQVNKMYEDSIETKRYYALLDKIEKETKPLSNDKYELYISELLSFVDNPDYQNSAWLYRKIGEVELDVNHKKAAFEYFEKALSLDPQIGVKRIASKLKKELEKDSND